MPSKLTFHLNGFDDKIFDRLERMQPGVVKVYEFPSDTNIDEMRRRFPRARIVYRQYTDLTYHDSADAYVAELRDTLAKLQGRGLIWEGINEPVLQNEADARALNQWFTRFAELMHAHGEQVAAFSFSTGNPNLDYVPLLAQAATACDYLALHEYHHPEFGGGDLTRYRQFRARLPAAARKPILITECGVDDGRNNGWQKYLSADQYRLLLENYDHELLRDSYVFGATIFQYGAGAPWHTFNVAGIGTALADYVANAGGGWLPAGSAEPTALEQAIQTAAQTHTWMPINTAAALYKFAQTKNLGYPQTDEFEYPHAGAQYLAQVFNLGIVYVKKGDWGNVQWAAKAE